jgi:K+-transporting ATPase A subunit
LPAAQLHHLVGSRTGVILIAGGLVYFPALALGPLVSV